MYRRYKCMNSYIMRGPTFPIEKLEETFQTYGKKKDEIIIDEVLAEGLESATHNLITELNKNKRNQDIESTLLKYIIRSTTRATPYGLLSGISAGEFAKNTDVIREDVIENKKRCRVDMGWLCSFISNLEKNEKVLVKISVKFNEQCIIKGDRIYNPYITSETQEDEQNLYTAVSIRLSEILLWIKQECSTSIVVKDLVEKIIAKKKNCSTDRVLFYIKQLIENNFLITELRPPLVNTDPLPYLIHVLKQRQVDQDIICILENVERLIKEYNSISIGKGKDKYKTIVKYMETLRKANDYLQTDLMILCKKNQLSYNVKKECEKVLNCFSKISEAAETDFLSKYKNDFIEKYGYHRVVPVMEVLDNDIGIGIPAGYTGAKCYRNKEVAYETTLCKRIKEYIWTKIQYALINGKNEVEIIEKDLDDILSELNITPLTELPSVDIFVEVLAKEKSDIDKNNFQILFTGASICDIAGRSWGRFSDMIEECIVKEFANKEQKTLSEDYIIASLCEFSRNGRLDNVTMNTNSYEYQISFNTNGSKDKQEIKISDIGIGVDRISNKLFAYSFSLNKKIKIISNNMLNPIIGSDAFRLLRDISNLEHARIGSILGLFQSFGLAYTPRIILGKTILAPATWVLEKKIFLQKSKTESWEEKFTRVRKEWQIVRYVYIAQGDNRLLLDLDDDIQITLLYQIIKKSREAVLLMEAIDIENKFWIKDSKGNHYANEFVFSLYPEKVSYDNFEKIYIDNKIVEERVLVPGQDNWIYLKLYYCEERLNDVLGENLMEFLETLKKDDLLDKYFFIRYWDPMPHIRLRIRVKNQAVLGNVFQLLYYWGSELKTTGKISKVQYDTYEREIERYGGFKSMNFAETFFFYDSEYVNNLIKFKQSNTLQYDDEFIGIVSVFSLMNKFTNNKEKLEKWLSGIINRKDFRKDYKDKKNSIWKAMTFAEQIEYMEDEWILYLNKRNQMLQRYIEEMQSEGNEYLLKNGDLMGSLIHMFCNRYMGDNIWEKRIKAYIRHTLFEQAEQKKHFNKNK
ncbi:MAG: lantibiotic dehydratase [Oscillospiraceae bacterium]|uniref:lantibiotic dehydratase n=1 Tax=Faecalibacillus intestinalis TaxID=1982626 RepID=UPI000E54FD59|nr:hypothetical protein DW983_14550 [Ruminococcus sp. AM49-8]RGF98111.1 hypothetical protein DW977_14100 [Ruminococcus sp. AM49-10BH]UYJ38321.1 MAG: lantibiotic dehydratase [Oscillospiraceae bacterium]